MANYSSITLYLQDRVDVFAHKSTLLVPCSYSPRHRDFHSYFQPLDPAIFSGIATPEFSAQALPHEAKTQPQS